jgi:hypothetical protein
LRNGFYTVIKPLFVNGYCTVANPLFVYSLGVIVLLLNVDPLKLAVAAQELRESLPLVPLLITPNCDAIELIKNITASEDSTWPIRTPNESIAFRIVIRLLFISVMGVTIQTGLGVGSGVGLEVGSGIGSGVVLLSI